MGLIEYFNPKSNLCYMGSIVGLFAFVLFDNNLFETILIISFSLLFIASGVLEGYLRNKKVKGRK